MKAAINIDDIFVVSENVVARNIGGEFVLIPVTGDIKEGQILALNESAEAIWKKLNGKKALKNIIQELSVSCPKSAPRIKEDVLDFSRELLRHKMIVKVRKK